MARKRWKEVCDLAPLFRTWEELEQFFDGNIDRTFLSYYKGGFGCVWEINEDGKKHLTVSSHAVERKKLPNGMRIPGFKHLVLTKKGEEKLKTKILEDAL